MEYDEENLPLPLPKMTNLDVSPSTKVSRYYSFTSPLKQGPEMFNSICRPVDLSNLGTTCWFNVAKLLYNIPPIRQTILEFKVPSHLSGPSQPCEFLAGLQELFVCIMYSERKLIDPTRAVLSIGKPKIAEEAELKNTEEFIQHTLQPNCDTSLHTAFATSSSPPRFIAGLLNGASKQLFANLPPVFLIDLCRMRMNSTETTDQFVKVNYSLSSMLLMDCFLMKNAEQVSAIGTTFTELELVKESVHLKIKSLAPLLENVPQLKTVYQSCQRSVDASAVHFDLLCSLNHEWEAEIQSKIDQHHRHSRQLDREMEDVQSSSLSTYRPYQLYAVVVHRGEEHGGHYWTYIWDNTHQVTWDATIVNTTFGGVEHESSARCLIYLDSLQTDSLLGRKAEYVIEPTVVLRYSKDNTAVRTRHAAYEKNQTLIAVLTLSSMGQPTPDASTLLYRALDIERRRLYFCRKWLSHAGESIEDESRLIHFGVCLLANQVGFEPYLYWSTAARHDLAFMENSATQEQKYLLIQWNTAYYQFRLILRHVMNGITEVFSRNFSAALSLAVKALYLHHGLTKNLPKGPAMRIRPSLIHSLIDKADTSLSDELLESDLESVSDVACTFLFKSIVNRCEHSNKDNLEAA